MTISEALTAAAAANDWNATRVAVESGVTEAAARRWMKGQAVPTGDKLMLLRKNLPGFAERLDAERVA